MAKKPVSPAAAHKTTAATCMILFLACLRTKPSYSLAGSHSSIATIAGQSEEEGNRDSNPSPAITTTQRTSIAAATASQHTMLGRHLQQTPQQQVRCARRAAPFQRPRMTAAKAANGTTQRKDAITVRTCLLNTSRAVQFFAAAAQRACVSVFEWALAGCVAAAAAAVVLCSTSCNR